MRVESPESTAQLSELLRECQNAKQSIEIAGSRSKQRMAGPLPQSAIRIETKKLNRVLAYDPRDLTISVEAGILYSELTALLSSKGQFLPIEPPFAGEATIGGILSSHSSGHRRRLFGTVRDLVIGMHFATLQGKMVQSGGMVVKNVAGLDFAKLLTGSFGTLACIAVVNFKLMPRPAGARTFLYQNASAAAVFAKRNDLLKSVLQPSGIDILNPAAAQRVGLSAQWTLLVEALGSDSVLARYSKELPAFEVIGDAIWLKIREFTPDFLNEFPTAHVTRISCPFTEMESWMTQTPKDYCSIGRAGNGIIYNHSSASLDLPAAAKGVIAYSPEARPAKERLWPKPGNDFFLMEKIKRMMDPNSLLNPGRLYGRI